MTSCNNYFQKAISPVYRAAQNPKTSASQLSSFNLFKRYFVVIIILTHVWVWISSAMAAGNWRASVRIWCFTQRWQLQSRKIWSITHQMREWIEQNNFFHESMSKRFSQFTITCDFRRSKKSNDRTWVSYWAKNNFLSANWENRRVQVSCVSARNSKSKKPKADLGPLSESEKRQNLPQVPHLDLQRILNQLAGRLTSQTMVYGYNAQNVITELSE